MTICDNRERLVAISVMGQIHHPTIGHSGTFKLCHDGTSGVLPSVGGITYNVKLGDCVYDKVCDHVESGDQHENPDPKENDALVMLACIGNKARVVSGDAKGAAGFVTGFHGGIEHTLLWFPEEELDKMLPGDRILIRAYGQGLSLNDFPEIMLTGVDPALLDRMGLSVLNGKLAVPVAAKIPAHLMAAVRAWARVIPATTT